MRIFRYLMRETFKSQIAVLAVLMTIFVSQKFVRVLADASAGEIPGEVVIQLLGLNLPALAALILPLSLFLGILLAHGRIYADHEMTVLHACGVSEWYVTRVTLVLATALALVTAALTILAVPWSLEQERRVEERARNEAGLSAIIPGRFQQASNQKAVIFVQGLTETGDLDEVFVAQNLRDENNQIIGGSVVMADTGRVVTGADGAQNLLLNQGTRYASEQQRQELQIMAFDSYRLQIKEQESAESIRKLEAYSMRELWAADDAQAAAEWQWRLAIPLAMPLLTLIAVPLSRVNPRQGKFARMAPALMIYLGYFLVLMAARSAVSDGLIPSWLGLWWIHGLLALFGAVLLVRGRSLGMRWWAKLRWSRP